MALSEHPNPTSAWAAAARWLLALDDPPRGAMVALAHEAYRSLRDVPSINALLAAYRDRSADQSLWDHAQRMLPNLDAARACRLARDAAYYRRYRELLDGRAR